MITIQNKSLIEASTKQQNQSSKSDGTTFLPLVSSEDFLPSVNRWVTLGGLFLVVTVITAVTFAQFRTYKVTIKANGTVRPVGELRVVQPEMEGTVKSIHVKDLQLVKKGDIIATLDSEQYQIKKSQFQSNIQQTNLQIIQIDAQIKTLETQILAESRVIERTIISAKADLERNQKEYQERKTTTYNESLAAVATLEKSEADLRKAQADLAFAKSDTLRYQSLATQGAIAKREFEQKLLILEQAKAVTAAEAKSVEIAKAKHQSTLAALNPSSGSVSVAQERIAQEKAKGEATIATLNKEKQALIQRRAEIESQLKQAEKELQQAENQLQKNVIHATSDGVILKLNLRNPGQVVRTSESIAEIAPQNASLVIKVMIPPGDIKQVAINQKVQMRVDACPYPDYGTLNGIVKAISPDTITQQSNSTPGNSSSENNSNSSNSNSFFEATIQPESLTFGNKQHQCQIQPGMQTKADIISREETLLRFLLRKARLITDL